jgi:hypothetical protein
MGYDNTFKKSPKSNVSSPALKSPLEFGAWNLELGVWNFVLNETGNLSGFQYNTEVQGLIA